MNFDDFVHFLYGEDVFDDENSKYIRDDVLPYLLPALEKLVRLIHNEKEKHKYFNILHDNDKKDPVSYIHGEKSDKNIEQIDIFTTDKLNTNTTQLIDIQQEVMKKYVDINPIMLLGEYLVEEYNNRKNEKLKETK
ncbi:conserved protein, unknown function [Hepatocystis sp. ex Piliocolobus tephrosceles]|nr:conserved protein, unknown function [Hepatocystis sp. ex Piliocolobus tephrosceles]